LGDRQRAERPEWQRRLREAVLRSGEKQSLIAYDAHVAPETLSRLLNDPKQRPRLDTIERVAHAVGVSVGWLLGEDQYRLTAAEQEQLWKAAELIMKVIP
jgi:transcriptional regulator with XRE-family HTH domain